MFGKIKKVVVVLATAVTVATLAATAAGTTALPPSGQCVFNDECNSPLICSAHYCRAECRTDRDCTGGATCNAASQRCVAPPARLPPNGFIMGRVETADGRPVRGCTVELANGTPGRASCDAKGEFLISDLQPGRYQVRIQPVPSDLAARTLTAFVDSGVHTYLGGVTLSGSVSVVNTGTFTAPLVPGALKTSSK